MAKKSKTISLTRDHVYMPSDLLTGRWQGCEETQRYPARVLQNGQITRAKYEVHEGLADFLIGRDQAIEVPSMVSED
jgi:hypothetical protein